MWKKHRIIESSRLEKTFKIKCNHQTDLLGWVPPVNHILLCHMQTSLKYVQEWGPPLSWAVHSNSWPWINLGFMKNFFLRFIINFLWCNLKFSSRLRSPLLYFESLTKPPLCYLITKYSIQTRLYPQYSSTFHNQHYSQNVWTNVS